MALHEHSTVVGVFRDTGRARDAIEALKDAGFNSSNIGVLMHDRDRARDIADDTGADAGAGAVTGAIGGGILGGIAGWLVGMGAIAIPGIGPFIAAGAIGSALAGAGIGAGVGAIAGALVGMGVPQEEASWYEEEVKGGNALVIVHAEGRYSEAREILFRYGAYDVHNRETYQDTDHSGVTSTWSPAAGETGAAPSEHSTMPGDRETTEATSVSGHFGDTAARMDPNYEGPGTWYNVMPRFRDRWQQRYGVSSADRWDDYEPGYRYGWEMRDRPEYQGRTWREVEPAFKQDWGNRYQDRPWERFSESIRDAWEDNSEEPRQNTDYDRSGDGFDATRSDHEIVGGEDYPPHDHRFVGDRCEVCGATRRYRRAA